MNNRLLFILVLLGLAALWYFAGRHDRSYRAAADRPNDPWVFRSVLDKQARMITFALDDHLWVAYSTDSCSLY
ncbi:MAG: hypothetical protein KDC65_15095, partial [Saprospiraceae bacterium]|nr:hypothetical protein [Saprospiraceae bacterium]